MHGVCGGGWVVVDGGGGWLMGVGGGGVQPQFSYQP